VKEDRQLSPPREEELRDRKVRLWIDESSFRGRGSVISVTKLRRRKWLASCLMIPRRLYVSS